MRKLRIGLVCPYGWDTPGGVQSHMRDLAEYLILTLAEYLILTLAEYLILAV